MRSRPSPRPAALALAASLLACGFACAPSPRAPAPAAARAATQGGSEASPCSYGAEPAVSLAPEESSAIAAASRRLSGAGATPRPSGALVLAARELAGRVADGAPLDRGAVRAALARACAPDPAPASVVVRGAPEQLAAAAAEALPRARATDLGAGVTIRGGAASLVLLASERTLRLAPLPRDVPAGARATLSGSVLPEAARPRVFVEDPRGAVREVDVSGTREFSADLAFPHRGRYTVEVVTGGALDPRVAALLTVSAGGAPLEAPSRAPAPAAGEGPPDAEAAVAAAVNATRRRQGLAPLARAAELDAVARRHSTAMAAAGRIAHVLPGSGDVGGRLRAARIPYRRVYENVARAASALEAHETVEESPAHLANVLAAEATRLGVGIARVRLPSGRETVYLTEVFVQPADDGAGSPLTPEARVREALWRERARRGLPPLTSDPALDALAREQALALRSRDDSAPAADTAPRALAGGRSLAAVDVFVASAPDEAIRSTNLVDARLRRVGVGIATGDSPRFGAGRLWIAVVYTD